MAQSPSLKDSLFELIDTKNYVEFQLFVRQTEITDSTYADYDAVLHACSKYDHRSLNILLGAGARTFDDRNVCTFSNTPMHYALARNDTDIARSLLRHGFSFRNIDVMHSSLSQELLWTPNSRTALVDIILDAYANEKYNPPDRNHLTPSHIACMRGTVAVLQKFLQFDKSALSRQVQKSDVIFGGATALHLSVMYGRHDHVKLLLDLGAHPIPLNDIARTPLHYAAYHEDRDMVKLLFQYLDLKSMSDNPRDQSGISLFHIACWLAPVTVVQDLLVGNRYDVNDSITEWASDHRNQVFFGYSPLHFAVQSGDVDKIRVLLANGANPSAMAGQRNRNEATPLVLAVKCHFKEAIDVLTEVLLMKDLTSVSHDIGFANLYYSIFEMHSCNNLPPLGYWNQCPPLHYAVARRDAELVEKMLKAGADVNERDDRGVTPLIVACILTSKMAKQVKNIVIRVAGDRRISEKTRRWFIRNDSAQLRIFNLLLEYNADVNIGDHQGKTPIAFLTMNSLFNWVEFDATQLMKETLFGHSYRLISQLLQYGASVSPSCEGGSTLIHLLCGVHNMSDMFVTNENARLQLLKLYVNAGCDVNAKTDTGVTPLFLAVDSDMFYLAEELIKYGADIFAKTNYGETVLHALSGSFASSLRERFVMYLMSLGIDIDAKTNDSSTILHHAIRLPLNNNNTLVTLLLEHGANFNATDLRNATPLHYAIAADNWYIVNELMNFGADMDVKNEVGETPLTLAGRMVVDVNNWEAALLAARFIYRMRMIGKRFSPENNRFVDNLVAERPFDVGFQAEPIMNEISRLKSHRIAECRTFTYNFLTKSIHDMRYYMRNVNLAESLVSKPFLIEFPLFGPVIAARVRRAVVRQRMFEPAKCAMSAIMCFDIPEVTDAILKHFSDVDLRRFLKTSLEDTEIRSEVESCLENGI